MGYPDIHWFGAGINDEAIRTTDHSHPPRLLCIRSTLPSCHGKIGGHARELQTLWLHSSQVLTL